LDQLQHYLFFSLIVNCNSVNQYFNPKRTHHIFETIFSGIDGTLSAIAAAIKAINFQLTDPFVPWNILDISMSIFEAKHRSALLVLHDEPLSSTPLLGKQSLDITT
jgi:hypothetical protein